jgi:hypothetical protein
MRRESGSAASSLGAAPGVAMARMPISPIIIMGMRDAPGKGSAGGPLVPPATAAAPEALLAAPGLDAAAAAAPAAMAAAATAAPPLSPFTGRDAPGVAMDAAGT